MHSSELAPEKLVLRVHGQNPPQSVLVYLPGLHGDWTLVGNFRRALAGRVRFVEATYPRTLNWTLDDYAAAMEEALAANGISQGWLLGESFGSQVLWALVSRQRFQANGIILAGGFVKHPASWAVHLAGRMCGGISLSMLTRILFGYARIARARFRNSPEWAAELKEFLARRTELDLRAAKHRLDLISANDHRTDASRTTLPIYAMTGGFDPIVPWPWVRSWLKRHAPSLREYRVIWPADHNVLGTATAAAAEQALRWMKV